MSTRTVAGLRLVTDPNGWWKTEDGSILFGRARAIETCETPHPMRYRDERGVMVNGYCEGYGEFHDREIGWDVRTSDGREIGEIGDLFPTLTEAVEAYMRELARRAED